MLIADDAAAFALTLIGVLDDPARALAVISRC